MKTEIELITAERAQQVETENSRLIKERDNLQSQLTQAQGELAQEKKWKEEDPRMLREQIRVADEAFNFQKEQLHQSNSLVLEFKTFMDALRISHDLDVPEEVWSDLRNKTIATSTKYIPREEYERLLEAHRKIVSLQPCLDNGACFYPMHDGEGNYIGEQNLDPIGVIQSMAEVSANVLHESTQLLKGGQ